MEYCPGSLHMQSSGPWRPRHGTYGRQLFASSGPCRRRASLSCQLFKKQWTNAWSATHRDASGSAGGRGGKDGDAAFTKADSAFTTAASAFTKAALAFTTAASAFTKAASAAARMLGRVSL